MSKTINAILNLTDKFTPKLTKAREEALVFQARMRNANSAAREIDAGLNKMAKSAVAAGAAGAAALAAFGASAVNTYKDFQQSMSNVAGILSISETSEKYKELEKAAREAGKTTTKTAKESADALSYMALAGWTTEDSIKGLMPVLRASEATGADLATTSDLITDSMSAYGLSVDKLGEYLDICARAQNKSNTTLTQMQEAYIAVGGTFKAFNTPLQESGALLGILANRGIKGAEAGTRLQSTLVNLTKQSGQSAKAMAAIGVSAYDSTGKFRGVTNVLRDVQAATAKMTEEERNNYLTMIAGKTQMTTLNALMSGLVATTSEGKNEFQALYDSLGDANGALDAMADTMTDNLSGSLARAQSAFDDFKISIGKRLEPYVSRALDWFANKLPGAAEKIGAWFDSKLPKAIDFTKAAFEKIKPIADFVVKNFGEIASAGAGVVVGLKAFSVLTKVNTLWQRASRTASAYTGAAKLAKIAQAAFNTSLLSCPLTWIAAGIGTAVGGILLWKKHLEKADIAKHFGDITLSAEECGDVVKGIFGQDLLNRVSEAESAQKQLKESLDATRESAEKLNKLNIKINLGGNVSKEDYEETVDEYIKNLQEAADDNKYALKLSVDMLFGDSSYGEEFKTQADVVFAALGDEISEKEKDLKDAYQKAFDEGFTPDTTQAVENALSALNETQEKIAAAQSEAKIEALKLDFVSGDLSKESFQNMLTSIQEETDKLRDTYNESRINSLAAAKMTLDETGDEDAYNKAVENIQKAYTEKTAGLTAKGLQYATDAIASVYDDTFKDVNDLMNESRGNDWWIGAIGNNGKSISTGDVGEVEHDIGTRLAYVDPGAARNIGKLYDEIEPMVEQLRTTMQNMNEIPESYVKAYEKALVVGAVGKNSDARKAAVVTSLSELFPADQTKALEQSKKYTEYVIKGITGSEAESKYKGAGKTVKGWITDTLTRESITIPINFAAEHGPKVPSTPASGTPVDSNAVGTTYFGGGFTRINENGGEIINLPTGSQVIPADKSEKLVNNKNNVNVTVQIMGSIFGTEEAAEIIGNAVCVRVAEMVKAM